MDLFKVTGQILFVIYTRLVLSKRSDERIEEISREYELDSTEIPSDKIEHVDSVNSDHMYEKIKEYQPDLVIINGTPIIKKHILDAVEVHFLNIHVGLTPKYRGVHGGYWALYNKDENMVGVTTHFVDASIDTGTVLDQKTIQVTSDDNFLTYTHIQAAALDNYNNIVRSILDDDIEFKEPLTRESMIWSHPTVWQYIYSRIFKKVK